VGVPLEGPNPMGFSNAGCTAAGQR